MKFDARQPAVVAVLGPTGAGKSELALALAEQFEGEIVGCDSVQVYRYLDVGSAKVKPEDRRGIPHHLIDILDPREAFTAGEYARRAQAVIEDILARGKLPVLAGGTGFYLRSLRVGLFPGPRANEALRARLEAREARRRGSLHRLLQRFDPPAAARIHPHDVHKLIRALEVCLTTRKSLTEWFQEGRTPAGDYRWILVGLNPPREALRRRLRQRTERMFRQGLVEEVKSILAKGIPETAKPLESVGYKQALAVLRGELTLEEAIDAAEIATRQYAKRQMTWFRREPGVRWWESFGDEPGVVAAVVAWLRQMLSTLRPETRRTMA